MNRRQFFDEASYQYRIKALEREVDAFRSGQKYVRMEEEHRKEMYLIHWKLINAE